MTPPNTELAACPFCGGEADTWIENEDDPDTECATCPNPDCVGSQVRTAVEHWNTRHLATLREDKGGERQGVKYQFKEAMMQYRREMIDLLRECAESTIYRNMEGGEALHEVADRLEKQ